MTSDMDWEKRAKQAEKVAYAADELIRRWRDGCDMVVVVAFLDDLAKVIDEYHGITPDGSPGEAMIAAIKYKTLICSTQ